MEAGSVGDPEDVDGEVGPAAADGGRDGHGDDSTGPECYQEYGAGGSPDVGQSRAAMTLRIMGYTWLSHRRPENTP